MPRFVEGVPRTQSTLFPERLEDYIDEENPVRAIDAFVDTLDLDQLGFHVDILSLMSIQALTLHIDKKSRVLPRG